MYSTVPLTEDDEKQHLVITSSLEIELSNNDNDIKQDIYKEEDDDIKGIDSNDINILALIKLIIKRAAPVCIGYISSFANSFISMTFAGHIKDNNIKTSDIFAGISLASMFTNVSFLSLILGMSSAIDTLASQNYGSCNYREVGIILQRSILISLLMAIPLSISWFYSESIFIALGVDSIVAYVIQSYLYIRILSMPIDIIIISYEKYLSAIGVVNPPMYSNIIQNITLVISNYILIHVYNFGFRSLAISWVIASSAACITMIITSYKQQPVLKTLLYTIHYDSFKYWYNFIALGIPATVMLCSEWWAFEVSFMK